MQRVAYGQVSLDAAPRGRAHDLPAIANVAISGKFNPEQIVSDEGTYPQLEQGEVVLVIVQDADGTVIAQGRAAVSIAFTDKDGFTIREQKVKL